MKLVRYGEPGAERPGLIDAEGQVRSLWPLLRDLSVELLCDEALDILRAVDPARLPKVEGSPRFGVPVAGLRQIIGIGLNYRDHAAEVGMKLPAFPMQFAKAIGSLSGATDPIAIPADAQQLDWEVELGVVIGTAACNVSEAEALQHVAGYTLALDMSEREWQARRGGQFGKGKSLDGFCPVGPWLLTRDEVPDPQQLRLWLEVNGQPRQDSSTAQMVFSVAQVIAHLSQYQTLLPGDLIVTGTPAGVGLGMQPPQFLKVEDRLRAGIDGLGEQAHAITLLAR